MKIMKFGGTSVGTPGRMRSIIPLINSGEKVIVVLSALSGTTNSLVEITDLLYAGKQDEAGRKTESLRSKYHDVISELYSTDEYRHSVKNLIDSHFDLIGKFPAGFQDRMKNR